MGSTIKNLLLGFIGSKKFVAMVAGMVVTLLAKYKFNVDQTTVEGLIGIVMAYVLGQGIADHGKGAAEVQALAQPTTLAQSTVDAIKGV